MTKAVMERMKANAFFFLGSSFYLPVALWDFISEQKGNAIHPRDATIVYSILELAATLAYLGNGLLETRTAYRSYQDNQVVQEQDGMTVTPSLSKKSSGKPEICNGLLFTIAAIFNVIFALKPKIIWLSLSAHVYVVNAILTLWLRRGLKGTRPARMMRAGDILFFLGATMDMTGTYLEAIGKLTEPAGLALFSASAWFADAILYLIADKMSLDEHNDEAAAAAAAGNMPSQPMISPVSELAAPAAAATADKSSRLSDIV